MYTETIEVTLTDDTDPRNVCRMMFGPFPDGTAGAHVDKIREDLILSDLPSWVTFRVWMRPTWEPDHLANIVRTAIESMEASRV